MHANFQCGCSLKIKAVRGNCFDAEDEQMVSTQLAVLNRLFKHTVTWRGHVVECREGG